MCAQIPQKSLDEKSLFLMKQMNYLGLDTDLREQITQEYNKEGQLRHEVQVFLEVLPEITRKEVKS